MGGLGWWGWLLVSEVEGEIIGRKCWLRVCVCACVLACRRGEGRRAAACCVYV